MLCNGVTPSVISFAALPYGKKEYHLSLTFSAVVNPIVCMLFYWVTLESMRWMIVWSLFHTGLSAYVVIIATESPCPPLNDSVVGGVLIVSIRRFLEIAFLQKMLFLGRVLCIFSWHCKKGVLSDFVCRTHFCRFGHNLRTIDQKYTSLSMFYNEAILSLISFAALPYGNKEYHLSLTLSAALNPPACIF